MPVIASAADTCTDFITHPPPPGHAPDSSIAPGRPWPLSGRHLPIVRRSKPLCGRWARSVMEGRRHPDIPRKLRSYLLGKFGRNRECGAGGDRQQIALPGNSKTKESAALIRETSCLKPESPVLGTSILNCRLQANALIEIGPDEISPAKRRCRHLLTDVPVKSGGLNESMQHYLIWRWC
jgi:hypothetical protein